MSKKVYTLTKLNQGWVEMIRVDGDLDGEPIGLVRRVGPGSVYRADTLVVYDSTADATHVEDQVLVRESDIIGVVKEEADGE